MLTFEKIKFWYDSGLWKKGQVKKAVPKYISEEEYESITVEAYA